MSVSVSEFECLSMSVSVSVIECDSECVCE